MLTANTGSSVLASAFDAGKAAALEAKAGLDGIKVAFAYASCAYDLEAMLRGVNAVLPGVPVIGNTSFTGVITPKGFVSSDDGFVGVMVIADDSLDVGVAAVQKGDCAVEAGKEAARKAIAAAGKNCAPTYFYMVAPPGEEEFYLKGITEVIGRVPFFGGSAADNAIAGEWKVFTDAGAFADGVAVAFFYAEQPMTNYSPAHTGDDGRRRNHQSGRRPHFGRDRRRACTGEIRILARHEKGRTARRQPAGRFHHLPAGREGPSGRSHRHPPSHERQRGRQHEHRQQTCRRHCGDPYGGHDRRADRFAGNGVSALRKKADAPLGAMLLVHCGGRRAGIGERIDEVAESIRKAAGDVPYLVEFTFGEYGFESDGRNTCGGLMLSFTGFAK
jgi:hypothetical protein